MPTPTVLTVEEPHRFSAKATWYLDFSMIHSVYWEAFLEPHRKMKRTRTGSGIMLRSNHHFRTAALPPEMAYIGIGGVVGSKWKGRWRGIG